VRRRWAGVLFGTLGVGLLPWALWLGYSLPERKVAHHWDLAWAGFDVVLSVALLGTALALLTGRLVGRSFAAATGALLLADAWFDVVTAEAGSDRWEALTLAVFAEIPLAVLCFVLARPGRRR
jgi:drug/metabolite transporter superfamily protein YnfA